MPTQKKVHRLYFLQFHVQVFRAIPELLQKSEFEKTGSDRFERKIIGYIFKKDNILCSVKNIYLFFICEQKQLFLDIYHHNIH